MNTARFARLALALVLVPSSPVRASVDAIQSLHVFSALNASGVNMDGSSPQCTPALDGMGHLYATATEGGPHGVGTLFEIDLTTGTFTRLVAFNNANGAFPVEGVTLDGQGHLFGTTNQGGSFGDGTVFEYDLASGVLTTLVNFNRANGRNPFSPPVSDGQGHLYGTTSIGGSLKMGVLYRYDLAAKALTTLVNFGLVNGAYPIASPTLDGHGNIYGTTYGGGGAGHGTVFAFNLSSKTLTTLVAFNSGSSNGGEPEDSVVLDGQGHLYGGTDRGGLHNAGKVFEYTLATHTFTTLAAFNFGDGLFEVGGVALDGQGNLYGTTALGGYHYSGTVFKINLSTHALTTVFNFNFNDGYEPIGGVALDSSGNLYGSARAGCAHDNGKIFELTPKP